MPTHFDQFAADYREILDQNVALSGENSVYFAEYKARYLARLLGRDFTGPVLDFGCGVGFLSGLLKKYFPAARIDGYDVSEECLRQIEPALAGRGKFSSDLNQLGGPYALIVVANVMHHVPPAERDTTIARLTGLLATQGRVALFEHNPANPLTRRTVDRCAFDRDAVLLPLREAASYLSRAGLHVERRDFIVFMPRILARLRWLEPWLAGVPLGAQYVVVGKKRGAAN